METHQTLWQGYGLPSTDNQLWTDVFTHQSFWLTLHDMPGIPTRVTLPLGTHGVTLWTADAEVWYTWGTVTIGIIDPGPIPVPVMGGAIPATAFVPGAVLLGGQSRELTLPAEAGMQHMLSLVSNAPNPTVLITAYVEG